MLMTAKEDRINNALDKGIVGTLSVNLASGGTSFRDMAEVCEFAKLMSMSRQAVPPHCREQPGVCLALTLQAIEWRMSPFSVANKSYVVNDRVAYESQLFHAVIEQRAPIRGRLRHEFSGEGNKRKCRVWATERESGEELSYTSPEFGTITPKNSPLWKSKPDLQLFYNTSRDWARVYYPDVIMGVYAEDEMTDMLQEAGGTLPKSLGDLTKSLAGSGKPLGIRDHVGMDVYGNSATQRNKEPQTTTTDADEALESASPPTEATSQQAPEVPIELEAACAEAYELGDLAAFARIDDRWFGEGANWTENPKEFKAARDLFEHFRDKLENSPSVKRKEQSSLI